MRYQLFGESHGPAVGIVLTDIPAGIPLDEIGIRDAMGQRSPGRLGTSPRREADEVEFLSGVYKGRTTGTPLCAIIRNTDTDASAYSLHALPRPGHADLTNFLRSKGFNDPRGGGHSSGRLTAPIVFAGYVAKAMLAPFDILFDTSYTTGDIDTAIAEHDSVGGTVTCTISGVRAGLGDPDAPWESELAHTLFSIPAVKGVEFGDGFKLAQMRGSEANDAIIPDGHGGFATLTNHSGGINGGIANGMPIVFTVAVRPTPSIGIVQDTVDLRTGLPAKLSTAGRHDPCIVPRIRPVIEAVAAIVTAGQYQKGGLI